jgi:hypothetical protein
LHLSPRPCIFQVETVKLWILFTIILNIVKFWCNKHL